jgi:hypothetical protein
MATNNASSTVARTEIEVAGRKFDRASATRQALTLIGQGATVPRDLAIFLREDSASKKALAKARADRKQLLINSGFTMITEAHSRGFKVTKMTQPKTNARGDEAFSVTLTKSGDGGISTVEIKSKLSQMSSVERKAILAELANLQAEMLNAPENNADAIEAQHVAAKTDNGPSVASAPATE